MIIFFLANVIIRVANQIWVFQVVAEAEQESLAWLGARCLLYVRSYSSIECSISIWHCPFLTCSWPRRMTNWRETSHHKTAHLRSSLLYGSSSSNGGSGIAYKYKVLPIAFLTYTSSIVYARIYFCARGFSSSRVRGGENQAAVKRKYFCSVVVVVVVVVEPSARKGMMRMMLDRQTEEINSLELVPHLIEPIWEVEVAIKLCMTLCNKKDVLRSEASSDLSVCPSVRPFLPPIDRLTTSYYYTRT